MSDLIDELAASLRNEFRGELIRPTDPAYGEARKIWNAMVERQPGLIARCANVADVQAAVRTANRLGTNPAVRCGGHSLAGFSSCQGGLVIDLSRLRTVSINEDSRIARAAGGSLLGSVDLATQKAALVFPAGVVSHTGASGLILGGGTGWLTRLFGLSCDNVAAFTVVLADGSVVRADSDENPDLFWGLRGGGGNFGIVSEFELKLHPLRSLLIGSGFVSGDEIAEVMRHWREFMPGSPEELKWNVNLRVAPNTSSIPEEIRGRPVLSQTAVWFGAEAQGNKVFDHIFSLGNPTGVSRATISFLELQTMADAEFPHGRRYYTKSGYFATLSDDSIDTMIAALTSVPKGNTQIELAYLGGAATHVGPTETAFGDRSAPFITNLLADWDNPEGDAGNIAWVRALFGQLRPSMRPGVYVNFMSGDENDRVAEAYGGIWNRLVALKTKYDPKNFFRLNQNIQPLTLA